MSAPDYLPTEPVDVRLDPMADELEPVRLPPPTPFKLFVRRHAPRSLLRAVKQVQLAPNRFRDAAFMFPSLKTVEGLSMVAEASLISLGHHVMQVLDEDIPGDLAECGVWRGGSSFFMADLIRRRGAHRKVWMFDSFEGLPPPSPEDGSRAAQYSSDPEDPYYFDNCAASIADVRETAARLGLSDRVVLEKGWFDQTLPAARDRIGPIALLRLDGDWYESTLVALENLYDLVSPGGFIEIDDYYSWPGCARAVHEFLGARHLAHRIVTVEDEWGRHCAYFRRS